MTLTDALNNATSWFYDAYGRMIAKRYVGQTFDQITYGYDANNRVISRKYWSDASTGRVTTYSYDANGNLTLVHYPVGTTDINYAYDADNRMTSMSDASGATAYSYTAWGALASEDGPWSTTTDLITYSYDGARRRTGMTLNQLGGGTFATTYSYDTFGRMNSVISPAETFGYTYATVAQGGNTYGASEIAQMLLSSGPRIDQGFDPVGRKLSTALKTSGGTVLNSHSYVYNAGNQRTKQTLADASYVNYSYVNYSYDNSGQLSTGQTFTSGGTTVSGQQFSYGYNPGWSMTSRGNGSATTTYTVNQYNETTGDSSSNYARGYDKNGNYLGGAYGTFGSVNYA